MQRCRILCRFIATIPVAALLTTLSSGCAPFIADQQSAKLLAPGSLEVTPSASYVSFSHNGETEHVQTQFGLRLGYGFSSLVELRGMVEHVAIENGGSTNILGAGAKIGLIPDRVSIYLPLGLLIGGGVEAGESWTAVPTLLVNAVTTPTFELTPSVKLLVPLTGDNREVLVGLHLGAAISNDLGRWALRPEVGLVRNPGDDGTVWGATLGIAFRP
jgi:hypothetical protein